jgi:hypothetical protein
MPNQRTHAGLSGALNPRTSLQVPKTCMRQPHPMISSCFNLRLADDAVVPVSYTLNPVLRFMGSWRELLQDEVGVATWSEWPRRTDGLADLKLMHHGCLSDTSDQPR